MNLNISHRKRLNAKADFVCEAKTYRKRHTYGSGNLFKKYIELFVFCCCLVYSSAFFFIMIIRRIVWCAFCCSFPLLLLPLSRFGFYFVFTLSTSLEFQFTLLLLFRAVTVPLSHAHKAVKWQRERERERAREREQLTQILLSHAREADVSGRARRVRVSGLLCIPSLHLIRSRSQGCPLCICFSIVPLSLCFYFVWFSDIPLTIHRHPLCILYLSDICTLHLFLFLWRRCGLYCCLILVRNTCIANFILLHCGQ